MRTWSSSARFENVRRTKSGPAGDARASAASREPSRRAAEPPLNRLPTLNPPEAVALVWAAVAVAPLVIARAASALEGGGDETKGGEATRPASRFAWRPSAPRVLPAAVAAGAAYLAGLVERGAVVDVGPKKALEMSMSASASTAHKSSIRGSAIGPREAQQRERERRVHTRVDLVSAEHRKCR